MRVRVGGRAVYTDSGFNLLVPGSCTAGDTFTEQAEVVVAFLLRERLEPERLCAFPGLDRCVVDFAVDFVEEASMLSLHLPADLIRAAGRLGIALEVTLFRTSAAGDRLVRDVP